jgi:hypothetical protein
MLRLCLTAYDRHESEIELATSNLEVAEEQQTPLPHPVPDGDAPTEAGKPQK